MEISERARHTDYVAGCLLALGAGWCVGSGAARLPTPGLVQSVGAFALSTVIADRLSSMIPVALRGQRHPAAYSGVGVENLLWLGLGAATAASVHLALGSIRSTWPSVAAHRAALLGSAGAIWGAVAGLKATHQLIDLPPEIDDLP
jgi:hypothetical protein